jgi:hypothetical protein
VDKSGPIFDNDETAIVRGGTDRFTGATGNKVVSNADVSSVKTQGGVTQLTSTNFRNDVNVNGLISNTDVSTTKAQVGTTLP